MGSFYYNYLIKEAVMGKIMHEKNKIRSKLILKLVQLKLYVIQVSNSSGSLANNTGDGSSLS